MGKEFTKQKSAQILYLIETEESNDTCFFNRLLRFPQSFPTLLVLRGIQLLHEPMLALGKNPIHIFLLKIAQACCTHLFLLLPPLQVNLAGTSAALSTGGNG